MDLAMERSILLDVAYCPTVLPPTDGRRIGTIVQEK